MGIYLIYLLLLMTPSWAGPKDTSPATSREDADCLFESLSLSAKGLSGEVFNLAMKGYKKLETEGKLNRKGILTIVDFSQSSTKKRFYVIDLLNKTLLFHTYVAHGRNTGDEYARRFSNASGSYESSLGFYVTRQQNSGSSVGLSLILDGLEKGFNDNALKREIIMHGAAYATEDFIRRTGRLGRSFGCPSLPPDQIKPVVEAIKEGTCLFVYSPDQQYILHSKLLN